MPHSKTLKPSGEPAGHPEKGILNAETQVFITIILQSKTLRLISQALLITVTVILQGTLLHQLRPLHNKSMRGFPQKPKSLKVQSLQQKKEVTTTDGRENCSRNATKAIGRHTGRIGFIGLIGFIGFIGFLGPVEFTGRIGYVGCLGYRVSRVITGIAEARSKRYKENSCAQAKGRKLSQETMSAA